MVLTTSLFGSLRNGLHQSSSFVRVLGAHDRSLPPRRCPKRSPGRFSRHGHHPRTMAIDLTYPHVNRHRSAGAELIQDEQRAERKAEEVADLERRT